MWVQLVSCWCRWAQFRQSIEEIDVKVKALVNNESVSYRQHIGGGHYVSVTSSFRCVDFHKWFMPYGQTEIRPTRSGIALSLSEWGEMQKLVETVNTAYPTLGTALPCSLEDKHQNQIAHNFPLINSDRNCCNLYTIIKSNTRNKLVN